MNKPKADNSSGMFEVTLDEVLLHRTGVETEAQAFSRMLYFSCLSYLSYRATGVHLRHRELTYTPLVEGILEPKIKDITHITRNAGGNKVVLNDRIIRNTNVMALWEKCYTLL